MSDLCDDCKEYNQRKERLNKLYTIYTGKETPNPTKKIIYKRNKVNINKLKQRWLLQK